MYPRLFVVLREIWNNGAVGYTVAKYPNFILRDTCFLGLKWGNEVQDEVRHLFRS